MKTPKVLLVCAALGTLVASGLAQEVSAGDQVRTSGLVTSRSGQELTIKTADAREQGRLTAEKVKFSKESLRVANRINAGLTPTNQAVQANKMAIASNEAAIATNKNEDDQEFAKVNERFAGLSDYETKETVTLHYAAGVSELNQQQKTELSELAKKTNGLQGFIVQVAGYTDSSGSAALNQKLSQERADNVVDYLQQQGNIPLRHIIAPGSMGEADPAGSNETEQGRSENRRVVVTVLVNKGLSEH